MPVARSKINVINVREQNFSVSVHQPVFCPVASPVPFVVNVRGQSQKKDTSPSSKVRQEIKFVKDAFSVDHCVFAPIAPNVLNVVNAHLIGGRLQKFWQKWSLLGSNPSVHFEGRLHSPVQSQTSTSKGPSNSQWLCKPEMATSLGPQCSKQIFERKNIQDGNPGNNSDLPATGRMGDIAGFQRRLFPHSSPCEVPKISQVPFPKSVLSVPGSSLWPLHSSHGVHLCGQRGETNGSSPGYKDPPVPRRLVDSSPYQRVLPPGHSIPPRPLPGIGLDNQRTKVGTRTQTDFRVRGLQVRPLPGTGLTDPEPVGVDPSKVGIHPVQTKLPSQELHVPDRPTYSDGKTGSPGETPHETHPVAPKTALESSGIPRKGDP